MLFRSCLAILIAASLLVWLVPANAAGKTPRSPDDHTELIETTGHQPTGSNNPRGEPNSESATPKQTPAPTDPHTEQIKRTVRRIGLGTKITVFVKNGDDVHGATTAIDQDKFQVAEVDLHQIVTIEYKNVRKVRSGYGGINLFTGKRTSQPHWVQPVIFAGVMGMLIVPLFFLRD